MSTEHFETKNQRMKKGRKVDYKTSANALSNLYIEITPFPVAWRRGDGIFRNLPEFSIIRDANSWGPYTTGSARGEGRQ